MYWVKLVPAAALIRAVQVFCSVVRCTTSDGGPYYIKMKTLLLKIDQTFLN